MVFQEWTIYEKFDAPMGWDLSESLLRRAVADECFVACWLMLKGRSTPTGAQPSLKAARQLCAGASSAAVIELLGKAVRGRGLLLALLEDGPWHSDVKKQWLLAGSGEVALMDCHDVFDESMEDGEWFELGGLRKLVVFHHDGDPLHILELPANSEMK